MSGILKPIEIAPLEAPWWAHSGHQQTLWAHFLPSLQVSQLGDPVDLKLSDGDALRLFIRDQGSQTVVVLFHGLSGDVHADYMQRTAALCDLLGLSRVLVNHRGAGVQPPEARKPYHSGIAEDVSDVMIYLNAHFPQAKKIAVGFSMSGNILLNLVSGHRGRVKPDAAVSVNAPIDLDGASRKLHQGLNRVYDLRFIKNLSQLYRQKVEKGYVDAARLVPWYSRVYDMDEKLTAPLAGFKNRQDYYEQCSAFNHVHKIQVPTYVLTAKDDPFVDVKDYHQASWSSQVSLRIEASGGHLGYLDKKNHPLYGRRWLDLYLYEALKNLAL